jgi:hypothetical protein
MVSMERSIQLRFAIPRRSPADLVSVRAARCRQLARFSESRCDVTAADRLAETIMLTFCISSSQAVKIPFHEALRLMGQRSVRHNMPLISIRPFASLSTFPDRGSRGS